MAEKEKIAKNPTQREANVLIEFEMVEPMSEEVLDANSDDVIEAVEVHAADIALGPVIALNMHSCSIKLRFDVLAANDAEIHKRIGKVIAIILRETDLELEVSQSSVKTHRETDETPAGKLAAA
jgi:prephenate dehydratase